MSEQSQAPLVLTNLLSRGFTMAEARKKLGLDKKPEALASAPEGKKAPVVKTNPAITPPPAKADEGEGLL